MSEYYCCCDACGWGFGDMNVEAIWCDCGGKFCSKKCGKIEIWEELIEEGCEYKSCVLCRKEKFTDKMILKVLLKHFSLTYEQAIEICKQQKDE